MVIVTYTLNIAKNQSLNAFDDVTHMAFGDDNAIPKESQTTLNNELLRVEVTNIIKDTINNTYSFTGRIPINDFNSNTVYEIGLFNAGIDGNMSVVLVLNNGVTKTNDEDLVFRLKIEVDAIDN